MDVHEFTERLNKIATVKNYRISSKDREAAMIALGIIRELEKSQPLNAEHLKLIQQTNTLGMAAR